jgi:hypothetical protein
MFDSWDKRKKSPSPNSDKPERIATKAPRHKQEMFIIIKLRVLVAKIFC